MGMRRVDCLDVSTQTARPMEGSLPSGVTQRILSVEETTGGEHSILEFAPGWSAPQGYNQAALDLYVLEGSFTLGAEELTTGCYTYIPAGMLYGPLSTRSGGRLLCFATAPFEFVAADKSLPAAQAQRHIPKIEAWRIPWADPMKDIVKKSTWVDPNTGKAARPPGVLTKSLRKDDGTQEVIALTVLSPGFVDPGTEHHPHNECLYLIAGDAYIGHTFDHKRIDYKQDLVLHKDFYIGRPPGIRHGPVCTQNGALFLIYMSDHYTGIYSDVEDWQQRVQPYLATEHYR